MNPFIRTFGKASELPGLTVHSLAEAPITEAEGTLSPAHTSEILASDNASAIIGETFSVSSTLAGSLAEVLKNIEAYKAVNMPTGAARQRFSKRIILGKHTDIMPAVCEETGAVVGILFPALPGRAFSYRSPLATLANAKAIAAEGRAYLKKLDAQILAAILITLAREFRLFQYAPTDTGAQKNAVLRTVSQDVLIDAVLLIHGHIHSANWAFMPRMSLLLDAEIADKGIHVRMQNWLRALTEMIYRPHAESMEEAPTWNHPKPERQISVPTVSKANKDKAALRKNFRAWVGGTKEVIKDLAAKGRISAKLKSFLLAVLTEDTITSADSMLIGLMCQKLESLNLEAATKVSFSLARYHKEFAALAASEFTVGAPNFSASAPGTAPREVEEDNEFRPAPLTVRSFDAEQPKAHVNGSSPTSPTSPAAPAASIVPAVSFAERIRLLKAARESQNASEASIPAIPSNVNAADAAQNAPDAPF